MKKNTLDNLSKVAKPFSYGKADLIKITELEELLGKPLPNAIKKFLLEWGGYEMTPPQDGDFSFVSKFPVQKGGRNFVGLSKSSTIKSIIRRCDEWDITIPNRVIYLEESDGCLIFISMLHGSEGEVYFMERDHDVHFPEFDDYEDEDAAVEAFDPVKGIIPNIFTKLGNSFDEFILNIKLVEADSKGNINIIGSPFK